MTTIKQLLDTNTVTAFGFPAIAGLSAFSTEGKAPAVVSSEPAAKLFYERGVIEYYTLVVPRGTQFSTSQEIVDADVPLQRWSIIETSGEDLPLVVTTSHQATLDVLANLYPDAEVISQKNEDGSPRNLSAADVQGKHVIGVLPPFLVAAAGAFTSVSIKDYDAVTDGDLSADQIKDRLVIAEKAITVEEIK